MIAGKSSLKRPSREALTMARLRSCLLPIPNGAQVWA
jgi:hypothetical protein